MHDLNEVSVGDATSAEVSSRLPERIVGILGMHRSGTSFLTGSLQDAGLFLGEHHTWNKHNRRGNRENQNIVDLHDDILRYSGGAWDDPPEPVVWSERHIARARELLAQYSPEPVFGFKDPRALLALEGWKTLFPNIEFVGIFRHPNAVAASLDKRQPKSWEDCMELWYLYNTILYREYEKKPFPVLNFDDAERILDKKISRVVDQLGLSQPDQEEKFYSPDLRHNSSAGRRLPWKVWRLHRKLKRISL